MVYNAIVVSLKYKTLILRFLNSFTYSKWEFIANITSKYSSYFQKINFDIDSDIDKNLRVICLKVIRKVVEQENKGKTTPAS